MRSILPLAALYSGALAYCPPTGPVFPLPKIQAGFNVPALTTALDALAKGTSAFNATTTSFSFTVTSLDLDVFEFHHTADVKNSSGVQRVDKNTIYRVASNTKVFMALATLLEFPNNLDDPIGKYVPELADNAVYRDVTLRLLAGHMGGVPRDGTTFDRYTLSGPELLELGFPVPAEAEIPNCDLGPGSPECSREAFFSTLTTNKLTNPPGVRAAYSDIGYILLGFALQGKTGKPFQQVISEKITGPLGLNSTGFSVPPISKAIVPAGRLSPWFDVDISHFKATAGLYTTPTDLTTFFRAILTSTLLRPAQTAQWLQPTALLSAPSQAVGMPWEIFRPTAATPDRRPVSLYTKSGDLPGYAAWAVLVPEFGVGVAINAAGAGAYRATAALLDLVAGALVPALEGEARRQVEGGYAGGYVSASGNDSLRLVVDDGPGLRIANWTTGGGRDVFEGLGVIKGEEAADLEARLYPIGDGGRWRMGLETPGKDSQQGGSMVGSACLGWQQVDQLRYAKMPLDEFDFRMGKDGVEGVEVLGLRATLVKEA